MKQKYLWLAAMCFAGVQSVFPCGWGGDDDYINYTTMYNEAVVGDEGYSEFFYSYSPYAYVEEKPNENCRLWAEKLGITKNQALQLVHKATPLELDSLLKGRKLSNKDLAFADNSFCKKNRKSLQYLSYAKFLQPYMSREEMEEDYMLWSYRYDESRIADLEYDEVMDNLKEAYNATVDKDLKLRYGYQLVRFAHYKKHYEEAVRLFETCVEPLGDKSEIYYYALSQKAGALNATGKNPNRAAMDFLTVYDKSKDLKRSAYMSLRRTDNGEALNRLYGNMSKLSKSEAASLRFMLAYNGFNDRLSAIETIARLDPNATQAKVLMARYVAEQDASLSNNYVESRMAAAGMAYAKRLCASQIAVSQDKDFWNLSLGCLNAMCHEYQDGRSALAKVHASDSVTKAVKGNFLTYMDICEPASFDIQTANNIFVKHESAFDQYYFKELVASRLDPTAYMAERYLLGYGFSGGKSDVYEKVIQLAHQSNKNPLQKWLTDAQKMEPIYEDLGNAYFQEGKIPQAVKAYKNDTTHVMLKCALGSVVGGIVYSENEEYNEFRMDYVNEFTNASFESITYLDLTQELEKIYNAAQGTDNKAAKANYLLGNFYRNIRHKGYYGYRTRLIVDGPVAEQFYQAGLTVATDPEVRARILFAMAGLTGEGDYYYLSPEMFGMHDVYYTQLKALSNTKFHELAVSKCSYYQSYINDGLEQGY